MSEIPSRRESFVAGLAFLLAAVMPQTWRTAVYRKTDDNIRSDVLRKAAGKLDALGRGWPRSDVPDLLLAWADDPDKWRSP